MGVDNSRIVQKWLWAGAASLAPWRRGILLKPYRAIYISVPKVACTSFKSCASADCTPFSTAVKRSPLTVIS